MNARTHSEECLHLAEQGRRLLFRREFPEAITVLESLAVRQPDWEHGGVHFNLAECYEETGNLPKAKHHYQQAVHYAPLNPYFLGGLASFLYLHGDATEALNIHLKLLAVERHSGNAQAVEVVRTAIETLRMRLGLSKEEITEMLENTRDGSSCQPD
jgi:Flp pilus assembly protein TadD